MGNKKDGKGKEIRQGKGKVCSGRVVGPKGEGVGQGGWTDECTNKWMNK